MTYILEYNEQYCTWHNNYFDERRQCFHDKLFSNGYKPVCMFDEWNPEPEELQALMDNIAEYQCDYEKAYFFVNRLIANKVSIKYQSA